MLEKMDFNRIAEKAMRDFVMVFAGYSGVQEFFQDGAQFDEKTFVTAAGAAASIAIQRALRDLEIPGFTATKP